jgi:DHA2 family multidrug resistance protein
MFSLMRNLGSSIGVSIVVTLLAQNTQANHATLADRITPFRPAMESPWLPHAWDWTTKAGATALSDAVTHQAMTIAFLDDFSLMMWITLLAIPLLLLMRPSKRGAGPTTAAAD